MHARFLMAAVAAAGVALSALPGAATNYGRALRLNESINGTIGSAEDTDDFVFEAGTGWKVSVKVKKAKEADLAPVLTLLAPDGTAVVEGVKAKAAKTSASLSATLLEGGRFAVRVSGAAGTGGYTLFWKLKQGKVAPVKNAVVAGETTTRYPFPACGGTLVSWKLKFKGDGSAAVVAVEDPTGGDAGYDPESDVYTTRKYGSETVKDFPLPENGPGGDWNLVVENKLYPVTLSLSVKMKLPKVAKTSISLNPEEPVLSGISNSSSTCGVVLALEGSNLGTNPQGVWFGPMAATGVSVQDGDTVHCTVPAGEGTVDVIYIASDGQTAVLEEGFTFLPLPTVTGFSPTTGPNTGAIELKISGAGFVAGSWDFYDVLVGGVPASQVRVNDDGDTITCIIPSHVSGPKAVILRNPCGQEIEVPGAFTYGTGIFINSVRPEAVPAFGGIPVTIGGTNFSATDTVFLDGVATPTTPILYQGTVVAHRIQAADLPAHAPGKVDIRVESLTGAKVTKSPGLAYFSFSDATSTAIPTATATDDWGGVSMALSDKNGDGVVDWIIMTHTDKLSGTRPGTRVLQNNGSGVFTDVTATAMPAPTATENWAGNALLSGRLNEDQIPDLYLSRAGSGVFNNNTGGNEARMLSTQKNVDPWGMLLFPDASGKFIAPVVSGPTGLLNITGILVCNATWACVGEKRGSSVCFLFDYDFRSVNAAMGDLDGDFDQDIVLVNNESLVDFTGISVGTWVSCYQGRVDYQYYTHTTYGHATRILTTGSSGGLSDRTENLMETAASEDEDFRGVAAFVADLSGDFLNDILIVNDEAMTKGGNPTSASRALIQKNSGNTVTYKLENAFFPKPLSGSDDDWRGNAISCADLNADFFRDVIVAVDGPPPTGAAYSTRILVQDPITRKGVNRTAAILDGVLPAGDDGRARVIIARDVDKDGDADLLIGTPGDTGSGNRKTRFLLNLGPDETTGIPIFIDASSLFPAAASDPGNAVDIELGDVDGDGDLDIVLTDTHVTSGTTKRTRVWKQDR